MQFLRRRRRKNSEKKIIDTVASAKISDILEGSLQRGVNVSANRIIKQGADAFFDPLTSSIANFIIPPPKQRTLQEYIIRRMVNPNMYKYQTLEEEQHNDWERIRQERAAKRKKIVTALKIGVPLALAAGTAIAIRQYHKSPSFKLKIDNTKEFLTKPEKRIDKLNQQDRDVKQAKVKKEADDYAKHLKDNRLVPQSVVDEAKAHINKQQEEDRLSRTKVEQGKHKSQKDREEVDTKTLAGKLRTIIKAEKEREDRLGDNFWSVPIPKPGEPGYDYNVKYKPHNVDIRNRDIMGRLKNPQESPDPRAPKYAGSSHEDDVREASARFNKGLGVEDWVHHLYPKADMFNRSRNNPADLKDTYHTQFINTQRNNPPLQNIIYKNPRYLHEGVLIRYRFASPHDAMQYTPEQLRSNKRKKLIGNIVKGVAVVGGLGLGYHLLKNKGENYNKAKAFLSQKDIPLAIAVKGRASQKVPYADKHLVSVDDLAKNATTAKDYAVLHKVQEEAGVEKMYPEAREGTSMDNPVKVPGGSVNKVNWKKQQERIAEVKNILKGRGQTYKRKHWAKLDALESADRDMHTKVEGSKSYGPRREERTSDPSPPGAKYNYKSDEQMAYEKNRDSVARKQEAAELSSTEFQNIQNKTKSRLPSMVQETRPLQSTGKVYQKVTTSNKNKPTKDDYDRIDFTARKHAANIKNHLDDRLFKGEITQEEYNKHSAHWGGVLMKAVKDAVPLRNKGSNWREVRDEGKAPPLTPKQFDALLEKTYEEWGKTEKGAKFAPSFNTTKPAPALNIDDVNSGRGASGSQDVMKEALQNIYGKSREKANTKKVENRVVLKNRAGRVKKSFEKAADIIDEQNNILGITSVGSSSYSGGVGNPGTRDPKRRSVSTTYRKGLLKESNYHPENKFAKGMDKDKRIAARKEAIQDRLDTMAIKPGLSTYQQIKNHPLMNAIRAQIRDQQLSELIHLGELICIS